ncbi:GFA family protein [Histidinibacterium aquaticum]|uniref:GFA family protein n=1 Tax=Histidinibacterium aquaticum TaxID=2613962 RepID=A0A5J5GEL9_9RHOB|nr:GFA family protein [Histidinibacterium aquaticum]KAA9006686.1 GFA family protein [Histidinibacterium aquaticum]
MIEGRCLCGDVRIRAEADLGGISACFCDLCSRWGGGVQMGVEVPAKAVTSEGPIKTHRSSRLAERAWCDTCGSAVWFRYVDGPDTGYLELSPGLFDAAGGSRVTTCVYSDRAIPGLTFGPEVEQIPQAAYDATHPNLNREG